MSSRHPPDEVPLDPEAAAAMSGLRYVSDGMPGFRRRRRGRGWSFTDAKGKTIRDAQVRERLKALVIPPAWCEVWICPLDNGHLQATGVDDEGRKQYIYHPHWELLRNEAKFQLLRHFGEVLPKIRRRVALDLAKRGLPREKLIAAVIKLLELTGMRVGNEEYRQRNSTYGMVTLRVQHVEVEASRLRFHFVGKSDKDTDVELESRQLANLVRACLEIPGRELFQYLDADGKRHALTSGEVNEYLKETAGEAFTSKIIRTWTGTLVAAVALDKMGNSDDEKQVEDNIREAIRQTSEHLNNTPAICRDYYVHPAVLRGYRAGDRLHADKFALAERTKTDNLEPEELALLSLLDRHEQDLQERLNDLLSQQTP